MKPDFASFIQESLKPMRFCRDDTADGHVLTGFGLFDHVEGLYIHISVDYHGNVKIWQDITRKIPSRQRQEVAELINDLNTELRLASLCLNHEDIVELSCRFRLAADATLARSQVRDIFLDFWELPEQCGAKLVETIGRDMSYNPPRNHLNDAGTEAKASLLPLWEVDFDLELFREYDWSASCNETAQHEN